MAAQSQHNQQPFSNGYLPNGAVPSGPPVTRPVPGAAPLLPNQGRIIEAGPSRILCVADVRGHLSSLNDLAKAARASHIIHTGDFGFYDDRSLDRIAEKTLKHVAQYSPLISDETRRQITNNTQGSIPIKDRIPRQHLQLSQLPSFLNKSLTFDVPVYTVWGACEDVQVLEKLRSGEYKIDKLHIIDESHSRLLDVGGVKLRLLGLGGAVVMHKLFDNGEGRTTIAGGQGTMWTTLLQMGELVDTANRVYDPSETRVLVTHASPAREGLLNQLSVTLKVDFSISAGLHFRYGSSYNEFSVNPTLDHYRGKLAASKASFNDVWETVKSEVEPAVSENEAQQRLLRNALDIVNKMPSVANGGNPFGGQVGPAAGVIDETAFKNMWNFNLADAAFGWLVLEVEGGRIGTEMKAQGFNFAHRTGKNAPSQADGVKPTTPAGTASAVAPPPPYPQAPPQGRLPVNQAQQSVPAAARGTPPQQPSAPSRGAQPSPAASSLPQATTSQSAGKPTPSPGPGADVSRSVASPGVPSANSPAPDPESRANGAAAGAQSDRSHPTTPMAERKPSSGIFVSKVKNEEEARNAFSDENKAKIKELTRVGATTNYVAHFNSPDEMQAVLKATQAEWKNKPDAKNPPTLRIYEDRTRSAGNWGSSRGGFQGGYRSASDSEGGRGGRGSFRGGRGRGDHTRGRGPRGGARGGQAEGASAPAPSTST